VNIVGGRRKSEKMQARFAGSFHQQVGVEHGEAFHCGQPEITAAVFGYAGFDGFCSRKSILNVVENV
jgi:hypothetical protein